MEMAIKTLLTRVLKVAGTLVLLLGVVFGYNYLRHLIYWLPTESVEIQSADNVTLAGTLLMPDTDPPYAAVVMLHGSGPEGRNGPGYRILSNAIARSGVAVLFYDKRGVGESTGDFGSALYRDFITDGMAAVDYLARRDDIDASRIGLHTNSESGWLAPEIALRTGKVSFIFNRVGPPLSRMDTVIWEVRNDALTAGVAETDIAAVLAITMRRWQYYVDAAEDPSLAQGPERDTIDTELRRVVDEIPGAEAVVPSELRPYDKETYEGYAANYGYDPLPFLMQLNIPMVYSFAGNDINVPTEESVAFLEHLREQHDKDIEIVVIDGVGHAMAAPRGILNGGYVPELMNLIREYYASWAVR